MLFTCLVYQPVPCTNLFAVPFCSVHQSVKQQTDAKQQQQQPGGEELPIWVQREKMRELNAQAKPDLPWPLYLLLSSFVAIASVSNKQSYTEIAQLALIVVLVCF